MLTSKLMNEVKNFGSCEIKSKKRFDSNFELQTKNKILELRRLIDLSIHLQIHQPEKIKSIFDFLVNYINEYNERFGYIYKENSLELSDKKRLKLTDFKKVYRKFCLGVTGDFDDLDQASRYVVSGLYFHNLLGAWDFYVNKES